MGRPRTVSDAQILAAARRVFVAQGYAASTREIARAAGLSQAALFQRFADKTTLFLAAFMPARTDVASILGSAADPEVAGSLAALQGVAGRLLDTVRELVPLMTAVSTSPDLDRTVLATAHEQLRGETLFAALSVAFTRWHRRAELPAHLSPEALVEALMIAVHGVLLMGRSAQYDAPASERAALERHLALLWGPAPG